MPFKIKKAKSIKPRLDSAGFPKEYLTKYQLEVLLYYLDNYDKKKDKRKTGLGIGMGKIAAHFDKHIGSIQDTFIRLATKGYLIHDADNMCYYPSALGITKLFNDLDYYAKNLYNYDPLSKVSNIQGTMQENME